MLLQHRASLDAKSRGKNVEIQAGSGGGGGGLGGFGARGKVLEAGRSWVSSRSREDFCLGGLRGL